MTSRKNPTYIINKNQKEATCSSLDFSVVTYSPPCLTLLGVGGRSFFSLKTPDGTSIIELAPRHRMPACSCSCFYLCRIAYLNYCTSIPGQTASDHDSPHDNGSIFCLKERTYQYPLNHHKGKRANEDGREGLLNISSMICDGNMRGSNTPPVVHSFSIK